MTLQLRSVTSVYGDTKSTSIEYLQTDQLTSKFLELTHLLVIDTDDPSLVNINLTYTVSFSDTV